MSLLNLSVPTVVCGCSDVVREARSKLKRLADSRPRRSAHTRAVTLVALEARARDGLRQPLPGLHAQLVYAPRPRGGEPLARTPGRRQAAALLLLFDRGNGPSVLLTERASTLPHHAGQISFPGGTIDPGESIERAALREAHEEVALDPASVRVLGTLTPLDIPVSGFTVHVVVGVTDRPSFHPAAREVARVLEVDVARLIDPSAARVETSVLQQREYELPGFDVDGHLVWGATAMMLSEFLWVCGWRVDPWK
jgi:8-oxo-dGTP pyrophosphatase MutT (NUDIX family)